MPSPGDLPNPGLNMQLLCHPALQADSSHMSHQESVAKDYYENILVYKSVSYA